MAMGAVSCRRQVNSVHKSRTAVLPSSRGLPYELALLIPRTLYTGQLRDTLDAILRGSTPGLPQHEPMFRLNVVYADGHLGDGGFSGRHLTAWRTFRLRLLVDTAQTTQLGVARDVAARPQVEVRATAPTPSQLAQMLGHEREKLTDIFVEAEIEREIVALSRRHSQRVSTELAAVEPHARVWVPTGLKATKRGQHFLWAGTNLVDKDQNYVFYTYPWDGHPLSVASLVQHRDSVMRVNIPGSQPGQWMQTARMDGEPLVLPRARTINNVLFLEMRGLWELRAGPLGGPFVALARVDTARQRVIVSEGFVYSPHSPKRPLVRQMEAAIRTLHIDNQATN